MQTFRPFFFWSLVVRGLLVVALLAIAPLYESAHGMTAADSTHAVMPDMSDHAMSAGSMAQQIPVAHLNHAAACRILCFGWVEAATSERHEWQMTEIVVVLIPAPASLLDGIEPAPSVRPPKSAPFV